MKKIKVGIPRALLYYRYGVLWKNFFENLGCNVILSPETNREIMELGVNNTIDECCLSYKIYNKSMTGLVYKSMPYGAYPEMYDQILNDKDIVIKVDFNY